MHRVHYKADISDEAWTRFIENAPHETDAFYEWLDEKLRKYNGRDIPDSSEIEFNTKEDYLVFILKCG